MVRFAKRGRLRPEATIRLTRSVARFFRRAFEGAGGGGRWPVHSAMWAPVRKSLAARHRLAARAGFVVANSPSAEAIASVWASNLVVDGPSAQSRHPNRAMRRALESVWARFYSRAGFDGLDLCARVAARHPRDGDRRRVLLLLTTTQRGELRLRDNRFAATRRQHQP